MSKKKFYLKALVGIISSALIAINATSFTASATQKANEVIDYAETLIGISGRPNIITDYWNLVTEWCAETIVYVGDKTGVSDCFPRVTFVDRSGKFIGFRDWFEERGRFFYQNYYTPLKGDLIVFDYDNDNKGDHIGFVSGVDAKSNTVSTIEGNANDRVAANTYNMENKNILGYCKPYYNDGESISTTATTKSSQATVITTTTTTAPIKNNTTNTTQTYYVSSSIGCNFRNAPNYNSNNIIEILNTDTFLTVDFIENGFAHCKINNTNKEGYVHISTISLKGMDTYTKGCQENYYISSNIGCNVRSGPYFNNNITHILDTNTKITVLSRENEFVYCEFMLNGKSTNGYIHNSVISPLKKEITTNTPDNKYFISSSIGCNFRSKPNHNKENIICILDTNTPIKILFYDNGFAYCQVSINGTTKEGYVHTSVISQL